MENKREITIPLEIFEGDFNLIEIGLLNLLLASPHINEDKIKEWSEREDFLRVFHDLMDRGYVHITQTGDGKSVTNIDLEPEKNKKMNVTNAQKELVEDLGLPTDKIKQITDIINEVSSSAYIQGYNDRKIEEEAEAVEDLEDGFTAYGKKEDFS